MRHECEQYKSNPGHKYVQLYVLIKVVASGCEIQGNRIVSASDHGYPTDYYPLYVGNEGCPLDFHKCSWCECSQSDECLKYEGKPRNAIHRCTNHRKKKCRVF